MDRKINECDFEGTWGILGNENSLWYRYLRWKLISHILSLVLLQCLLFILYRCVLSVAILFQLGICLLDLSFLASFIFSLKVLWAPIIWFIILFFSEKIKIYKLCWQKVWTKNSGSSKMVWNFHRKSLSKRFLVLHKS